MSNSSDDPGPVELLAEEFLDRRKRGERPTIGEYCDRHPELAREIREVFEAVMLVEELKPGSSDESGSFELGVRLDGRQVDRVGDYRLLRQIGRGGMGVVFEAEQEELGRRVALKVLPASASGDAQARQRFQREAKAAARMHHTNIVPVFDVGHDSGHFYYAMQLIQGQGLDLETIVLKAIEKEPRRRYQSADDMANDLQRFIADEPIHARRISALERLLRWSHRNRAVAALLAAVFLVLFAGMAISTWLAIRARRAESAALAAKSAALAAATAEREANDEAQAREAETRAVLEFVETEFFAAARPEGYSGGLGREVKLRQAVEAALPYLDKSFSKQPLIEDRLRRTLGLSFLYLGSPEISTEQFDAVRALYSRHRGASHPDTLASRNDLALSYRSLGRRKEALKLDEETLALAQTRLGLEHPITLKSMASLAVTYWDLGRLDDALKLNEQALALAKARLGPDHLTTLAIMNNLANDYRAKGRLEEALKLHEETLALRKVRVGSDHPDTLLSMYNLAFSYKSLGRHADALKLYQETLDLRKAKLGPSNPDTILSGMNVARSLLQLGRGALAAADCLQTVETFEKLKRGDVKSLYDAACYRAIAAAALRMADKSPGGVKKADAQADKAMLWLKQAVAAGFTNSAMIAGDHDLDDLRGRDDFKRLAAELSTGQPQKK